MSYYTNYGEPPFKYEESRFGEPDRQAQYFVFGLMALLMVVVLSIGAILVVSFYNESSGPAGTSAPPDTTIELPARDERPPCMRDTIPGSCTSAL